MLCKKLQKEIENIGIEEFMILEYKPSETLTIIGSRDLGYYHQIEIKFSGVSYISCPTTFNSAFFREAEKIEKDQLIKTKLYYCDCENGIIFCIITDYDSSQFQQKHYIVAEAVDYNSDMVYHYKRDNLKPNERIAEWVK